MSIGFVHTGAGRPLHLGGVGAADGGVRPLAAASTARMSQPGAGPAHAGHQPRAGVGAGTPLRSLVAVAIPVMIQLQLRYFASLREALGASESIAVPEGTTVGGLRGLLVARGGLHAELLAPGRPVRAAVSQQVCGDDTLLSDGVEVAFFPPVTGG